MFIQPRRLEKLTKEFQILCDAVMDLNPQPLVGKIPDDLLESAHLLVMADAAVVRECNNIAEILTKTEPYKLIKVVMEHHQKLSHYLFIRSMILDGNPEAEDDSEDSDLKIF